MVDFSSICQYFQPDRSSVASSRRLPLCLGLMGVRRPNGRMHGRNSLCLRVRGELGGGPRGLPLRLPEPRRRQLAVAEPAVAAAAGVALASGLALGAAGAL